MSCMEYTLSRLHPSCMQGRHILWGWVKELRNVPAPPCLCNKYDYAGATSLPRALYIKGDRLHQVSMHTRVLWIYAAMPTCPCNPDPIAPAQRLQDANACCVSLELSCVIVVGLCRSVVLHEPGMMHLLNKLYHPSICTAFWCTAGASARAHSSAH